MKKNIVVAFLALVTLANADLKSSLTSALEDEYHAHAFYQAVMLKHGETRPFSNIVNAEQCHADAVAALMRTHGLPVPSDRFARRAQESPASFILRMKVPATLRQCAEQAATVERKQGPFYDALLATELPDDVRAKFIELRADSLERHLPAFERFVNSNRTSPRTGPGKGRNRDR